MGTATATGVGARTVVMQCACRCFLCSSANRSLSVVVRNLLGGGDDCSAASIDAILSASRWQ